MKIKIFNKVYSTKKPVKQVELSESQKKYVDNIFNKIEASNWFKNTEPKKIGGIGFFIFAFSISWYCGTFVPDGYKTIYGIAMIFNIILLWFVLPRLGNDWSEGI